MKKTAAIHAVAFFFAFFRARVRMQRVQILILTPPTAFVWRFTFLRTLVAMLECERVCPVRAPRPQAWQIQAMAVGFVIKVR